MTVPNTTINNNRPWSPTFSIGGELKMYSGHHGARLALQSIQYVTDYSDEDMEAGRFLHLA